MQHQALIQSMADAAQKAAKIIQSREHLEAHDKSGFNDIVTIADVKSNALITDMLHKCHPECVFLSEESDTEITRENFAHYKLVFVIDPIDGTTNYKYGIPASAISIGAWIYGGPIASVIYDLANDDIYTAIRGDGVRKNGKRLVNGNNITDLKKAVVGSDWGYGDTPREIFAAWSKLVGNVMALRVFGCAVMGLVFVVTGQYTCYVHNTMKPYDSGAAVLMLKECGLTVTNWNGEPYSVFDEQIIVAPPHLHDELLQVLFG